ncbi:MAG: type I-E CRISPR-associated protein Cse2/CasB [Chloroflexia bacterium]|nr:type I-E CRISPR-associated protein Cse2/CasB [Chloroflexia bacterium]
MDEERGAPVTPAAVPPPRISGRQPGWDAPFIASLQQLNPDPRTTDRRPDLGALAALRRGLGREPGEVIEMCRYVDAFPIPTGAEERAAYLVASLFGWHPRHQDPGERPDGTPERPRNLGDALWQLQNMESAEPAGVERRFMALLDADRSDLDNHLRQIVSRLRQADIPLDYARLLRDIRSWDHPDRFVQRQWARSYWGGQPSAPTPGSTAVDEVANGAGLPAEDVGG